VLDAAGTSLWGTPSMTEVDLPFPKKKESPSDVSIKTIAAMVVTFVRNEPAPLLPKTV
jgi:hypothetical protein